MQKKIYYSLNFIIHHLTAISRYKLHSPFLFEFIHKIRKGKVNKEVDELYTQLSENLLSDHSTIEVVKFKSGSGTSGIKSTYRQIRSVAKHSDISLKKAQVLARLLVINEPEIILEFGTSLGLASCLMATAFSGCKIFTFEGCSGLASVAQDKFNEHQFKNIELQIGNYNHILDGVLQEIPKIDFLFFNGSDDTESILKIYEKCLRFKHNESLFVFNEIYRSKAMQHAWTLIQKHNETVVSIDFFNMGIVLFRKELSKQQIKYKL